MARTTVDIDTPLLKELKALRDREGRSLGRLVSELLAEALAARKRRGGKARPVKLKWHSGAMGPLIDINDPRVLKEFLAQEDAEKYLRLSKDTLTSSR
jgi:hypothetical protein